MIRLSEIRLPFTVAEAPEAPLRAAAAQILGLADADIAHLHVFKRSFDARKADLLAVYIVDIALAQPEREAALLAQFAGNPHIQPTPDMAWHPVGQAPADLPLRDGEQPVGNQFTHELCTGTSADGTQRIAIESSYLRKKGQRAINLETQTVNTGYFESQTRFEQVLAPYMPTVAP